MRGFTLIEVAIVTIVLTLLLGGLLIPLAAQVDQRRYAETRKSMDEIKEALIGFAQTHGRLPCPAPAGGNGEALDHLTDCDGSFEGDLAWATLNAPQLDAWGRRFHYRVAPEVVKPQPWADTFGTVTILKVNAGSQPGDPQLAQNAAAVVLSYGKNGLGTPGIPQPPAETDERENTDGDETFVHRTTTAVATGCSDTATGMRCEFDDVVVWISPFVLFPRMAQAGHFLPN